MTWLLKFFRRETLPAPAFDQRRWQLVDYSLTKSFKH